MRNPPRKRLYFSNLHALFFFSSDLSCWRLLSSFGPPLFFSFFLCPRSVVREEEEEEVMKSKEDTKVEEEEIVSCVWIIRATVPQSALISCICGSSSKGIYIYNTKRGGEPVFNVWRTSVCLFFRLVHFFILYLYTFFLFLPLHFGLCIYTAG